MDFDITKVRSLVGSVAPVTVAAATDLLGAGKGALDMADVIADTLNRASVSFQLGLGDNTPPGQSARDSDRAQNSALQGRLDSSSDSAFSDPLTAQDSDAVRSNVIACFTELKTQAAQINTNEAQVALDALQQTADKFGAAIGNSAGAVAGTAANTAIGAALKVLDSLFTHSPALLFIAGAALYIMVKVKR